MPDEMRRAARIEGLFAGGVGRCGMCARRGAVHARWPIGCVTPDGHKVIGHPAAGGAPILLCTDDSRRDQTTEERWCPECGAETRRRMALTIRPRAEGFANL